MNLSGVQRYMVANLGDMLLLQREPDNPKDIHAEGRAGCLWRSSDVPEKTSMKDLQK